MGCGESKGDDSADQAKIEFKHTNCLQMDDFFRKATATMKAFQDISDPLGDQKDEFYDVSGFYELCGASKDNQ
jgi:hypothetical protein